MIGQLKFLLIYFFKAVFLLNSSYLEAVVIPDKNETDFIAQYHHSVKHPMGKIKKLVKGER